MRSNFTSIDGLTIQQKKFIFGDLFLGIIFNKKFLMMLLFKEACKNSISFHLRGFNSISGCIHHLFPGIIKEEV
ncbi:MAG: hypothetical protein V6006_02355 [Candidatus Dasytiphilus stammeri]